MIYRQKPTVTKEAMQVTATNKDEVAAWCRGYVCQAGVRVEDKVANPGDYVVKVLSGFYACDQVIFERRYEPLPE
jgi:hypothetical protein